MASKKSDARQFREEVCDLIKKVMLIFDPSGTSASSWETYFASFKKDEDFVKEIKRYLDNPKLYFSPESIPFEKDKQPKFDNYKTLAKMLNIELDEYVALPFLNVNTGISAPMTTLTKVPVGKLHIKRLQQIVRKKNKIAASIEKRDQRKGQVTNEDKGARVTNLDAYGLSIIGAAPVLKELYGPRADAMDSKFDLYKRIMEGERLPKISDLPYDITEHNAINALNTYIMGASLMSDIVSDSYLLPATKRAILKNKFEKAPNT